MGTTVDTILRQAGFNVTGNLRSSPSAGLRATLLVASLFLVGIIGYFDYLTGYERPLLLFYLVPISLATWFGSLQIGLGVAVVSVAASMLSDLASGITALGFW